MSAELPSITPIRLWARESIRVPLVTVRVPGARFLWRPGLSYWNLTLRNRLTLLGHGRLRIHAPTSSTIVHEPPRGGDWLHEIKHDRLLIAARPVPSRATAMTGPISPD